LYIRPMDAAQVGPLGQWERKMVEYVRAVFDEEGRRAQQIVDSHGECIRPSQSAEKGPIGSLETSVIEWFQSISRSEQERVRTKTLRPKDLEVSLQGPLGQMEDAAVKLLESIRDSERMRMQHSQRRGGAIVRPIDVPGVLGEWESAVSDIVRAEQYRVQSGVWRPMESPRQGPLGKLEAMVSQFLAQVSIEENRRLESIREVLRESRPMETDRSSALGVLEAIFVGILRGPILLLSVIGRVKDLLMSEPLSEEDARLLNERMNKGDKGDKPRDRLK
jgi:hypothetical protein